MLPILQIGPLALRTPLLLALLGLYVGLSLAERRLAKDALSVGQLNTLVFLGLGCGLIVARLAFALQHWALFVETPLSLIALDGGLLDPWVGGAAGIIAMLIYGQRQKLSLWATLDALTPLLAVWVIFLSLAFLASGELYGTPTNLPWGVELWGAKRHPIALYHALAGTTILVSLWGKFGKGNFAGQVFLHYILLTAAVWLFLEAWRANSPLLPGGIRAIQALAWLVMGFAFWLLDRRAKNSL